MCQTTRHQEAKRMKGAAQRVKLGQAEALSRDACQALESNAYLKMAAARAG
jgi:hypothetical protein